MKIQQFLQQQFCAENINFYLAVEEYKKIPGTEMDRRLDFGWVLIFLWKYYLYCNFYFKVAKYMTGILPQIVLNQSTSTIPHRIRWKRKWDNIQGQLYFRSGKHIKIIDSRPMSTMLSNIKFFICSNTTAGPDICEPVANWPKSWEAMPNPTVNFKLKSNYFFL